MQNIKRFEISGNLAKKIKQKCKITLDFDTVPLKLSCSKVNTPGVTKSTKLRTNDYSCVRISVVYIN